MGWRQNRGDHPLDAAIPSSISGRWERAQSTPRTLHGVQICTVCTIAPTVFLVTLVTGRREANKMRTRTALLDAVYELLDAEGPDAVTAERLAEAAGISRRTFFNYFESVDALVASGTDDILDCVRRALSARPGDEPVLDAAYAVISELFTVEFLAEATRAWRAIDRHPGARRFALEASVGHTTRLAQDLAQRHIDPENRDPLRSAVLTAILLTAFDEARRAWLDHHDGPVDDEALGALLEQVRRAFDIVRPVFDGPSPHDLG